MRDLINRVLMDTPTEMPWPTPEQVKEMMDELLVRLGYVSRDEFKRRMDEALAEGGYTDLEFEWCAAKPEASEGPILTDRQVVDKPPEKRVLERVREWQHDGPKTDCPGASDPVYTPDNAIPPDCNRWVWGRGENCGNDSWRSKGFVQRDKKMGTIVDKEYERKRGKD